MISNKALYFVGAVALEIVSLAGLYLIENHRRKCTIIRRLQQLEQQLADLQIQIEQLKSDNHASPDSDDSDLEFYEFNDDEVFPAANQSHYFIPCPQTLKELDEKLDSPNSEIIHEALDRLIDLERKFPKSVEILWRIGQAHQKIATGQVDETSKQKHINKGLETCKLALELDPNSAHVHKWFALLIGLRIKSQPVMEQIKDAPLFKKHLDIALTLNPRDGYLLYMLGRFTFEIASLKWYERKAASLVFNDPLAGTFEEALQYCLEAETLMNVEFKNNKVIIAQCYVALGQHEDAVDTLRVSTTCDYDNLDRSVDGEIVALLNKYNKGS